MLAWVTICGSRLRSASATISLQRGAAGTAGVIAGGHVGLGHHLELQIMRRLRHNLPAAQCGRAAASCQAIALRSAPWSRLGGWPPRPPSVEFAFNPPTQRWATLAPAAAPPHLKAGLTCAAHALARSPASANALCRTSALGSCVATWRGVGGWEGWVGHYRMLHLVWVQLHLGHESHHTGRGDEWGAASHVWATACMAPSSGGKHAITADSPPAQCAKRRHPPCPPP